MTFHALLASLRERQIHGFSQQITLCLGDARIFLLGSHVVRSGTVTVFATVARQVSGFLQRQITRFIRIVILWVPARDVTANAFGIEVSGDVTTCLFRLNNARRCLCVPRGFPNVIGFRVALGTGFRTDKLLCRRMRNRTQAESLQPQDLQLVLIGRHQLSHFRCVFEFMRQWNTSVFEIFARIQPDHTCVHPFVAGDNFPCLCAFDFFGLVGRFAVAAGDDQQIKALHFGDQFFCRFFGTIKGQHFERSAVFFHRFDRRFGCWHGRIDLHFIAKLRNQRFVIQQAANANAHQATLDHAVGGHQVGIQQNHVAGS